MIDRHDPEYNRLIRSARWRKLREQKMRNDPLCEHCLREGHLSVAEQVHHIVPLETASGRAKEKLAFDYSNLASLCKECHTKAHQNREGDVQKIISNFFDRY